ncbi:MAG: FUSC family protein [Micrococcaceae bacterium]
MRLATADLKNYYSAIPERLKQGYKRGYNRIHGSIPRIFLITFAGMSSYWFCENVLGHKNPVYCVTVCVIALGFRKGTKLSVVIDIVVGSTVGITIAELLIMGFGSGFWQASLFLFLSLLLSRFMNDSVIFNNQVAIQGLFVILYPININGPFSRPIDALVGGTVAIILTMFLSTNPRKAAADKMASIIQEILISLMATQKSLRENNELLARKTLYRARETQGTTDAMFDSLTTSYETVKLSPHYRSYLPTLQRIEYIANVLDLAMRNCRILTRLSVRAIHEENSDEDIEEFKQLAKFLDPVIHSLQLIEEGISTLEKGKTIQAKLEEARMFLTYGASRLSHDGDIKLIHPESYGLLLIIRELYFDILRATGLDVKTAYKLLPDIDLPNNMGKRYEEN